MANEKREQARQLWEESNGMLPLKEIAEKLDVPVSTVRSWKARDGWGGVATSRTAEVQRATQRRRRATVNRKIAEAVDQSEALSDSEKDFCLHYVSSYNAAQAAWNTGRYSNWNSAKSGGWVMLQKQTVKDEIKRLKEMKRSAILADGDDVVELHMRIAFSRMDNFVTWGQEEVPVMGAFGPVVIKDEETGTDIQLMKTVNMVRFRSHDEIDGQMVSEIKVGSSGTSIKLRDSKASMEFLERWFMMNPMDRHKKEYDEKRLALEKRRVELEERKAADASEDALKKLDVLLEEVDRRA